MKSLDEVTDSVISFSQGQELYGVMIEGYLIRAESFICLGDIDNAYVTVAAAKALVLAKELGHLQSRLSQVENRLTKLEKGHRENEKQLEAYEMDLRSLKTYLSAIGDAAHALPESTDVS
jgi:chromosome segregation ATPase